MINDAIDLFNEPHDIAKVISDEFGNSYAEMTKWQQAFLCGLIRKHNPKKILEIGVSAGGTTAVIMNALTIINSDAKMFSVDILKTCYRDATKSTGFVATWAQEYLKGREEIKWQHVLLTGSGVCNYLDEIGDEIDFLILDTKHSCPGEILDFLAAFPFLSDNAIVVMHDIALQFANNKNEYATQLLLDTVTAKKIVGRDKESVFHEYPNIGAFQITEETGKHIEDVFSALNIPWEYVPNEMQIYREWYSKLYEESLIDLYDMACANNMKVIVKAEKQKIDELTRIAKLVMDIKRREVYIYGEGKIGTRMHKVLEGAGIVVKGHVVSDGEKANEGTCHISNLEIKEHEVIVLGVREALTSIIKETLIGKGIKDFLSIY